MSLDVSWGRWYGVGAGSRATLLAVRPVLGAIGIVAAFLPSLRAARIDPLVALRQG